MEKLCCPRCGNENLQVTTQVDVKTQGKNYSGGKGCLGFLMFGPLGLLCGSCGQKQTTSTTNTDYFVCTKCGNKFRNPEDLRAEIEKMEKAPAVFIVLAIIFAVILLILSAFADEMSGFLIFMAVLVFVVFGISGLAIKHQVTAKRNELYYIESGMRRFKK